MPNSKEYPQQKIKDHPAELKKMIEKGENPFPLLTFEESREFLELQFQAETLTEEQVERYKALHLKMSGLS